MLHVQTLRWNAASKPEPKDRLEETREYVNALEKCIVELEDLVKLLRPTDRLTTGRDSSSHPNPNAASRPLPKSELHNRGCAVSYSLGEPAVCTCPEKK